MSETLEVRFKKMNTYLFYDIETSGLNKAFDQVFQFAAIRTDLELNEIQRHNIKVKLRPDIIISPRALMTHRIPLSDLMSGECEFEAARQIHQLMNEPGTISLGYNSLGFDDVFLRFTFHRNLLPAYTHQYSRGCRRMDLFPMTLVFSLYKKASLNWPEKNGKLSLKLENLNSANQLNQGRAHDAMVDVEITMALARRYMRETETWDYLTGCFIKDIDRRRALKLPACFQSSSGLHVKGLMIGSEFGSGMNFQVPVISIGESIPYANQSLWLRIDLPELRKTGPDSIEDTTRIVRKRYGEPGILLPPLERYWTVLSRERGESAEENIRWLQENPTLFQSIIEHYRNFRYPEIPALDADAALYQMGFLSKKARALCQEFHAAPLNGKKELINQFPTTETRTLAGRILSRNFPENLSKNLIREFGTYMQQVNPISSDDALMDYRGAPRTTPASALADIIELQNDPGLDREQLNLLDDLKGYITEKFNRKDTS